MAGAAVAVVRAQALQLADGLGVAGREHAGRLVVALAVGALFRLAGPPRQSHAPQAGEKQCTGAQGQGGGGGRAAGSAGAAGSGGGGGGHPAQEAHFGGGLGRLCCLCCCCCCHRCCCCCGGGTGAPVAAGSADGGTAARDTFLPLPLLPWLEFGCHGGCVQSQGLRRICACARRQTNPRRHRARAACRHCRPLRSARRRLRSGHGSGGQCGHGAGDACLLCRAPPPHEHVCAGLRTHLPPGRRPHRGSPAGGGRKCVQASTRSRRGGVQEGFLRSE
mmetsp:Transcript_19725/g.46344  ORF Transcript_19725/g.46344 Transcript_19725/m.46344 type:complete len:277 (-) Transcript_19725:432-1262(-)